MSKLSEYKKLCAMSLPHVFTIFLVTNMDMKLNFP
jgi:hypothetical protein